MTGAQSIVSERARQILSEGFSSEYDFNNYQQHQLVDAAVCYAQHPNQFTDPGAIPPTWPWNDIWWKPKDRRTNLVRAGAPIAAEIDRIDVKGADAVTETLDCDGDVWTAMEQIRRNVDRLNESLASAKIRYGVDVGPEVSKYYNSVKVTVSIPL